MFQSFWNTHENLLYTISTECGVAAAAVHIKNKCHSSLVTNSNLTLISPHFLYMCLCVDKCVFYGSLDAFDDSSSIKYQILDAESKGKLKTPKGNTSFFIFYFFPCDTLPAYHHILVCACAFHCILFYCGGFIMKSEVAQHSYNADSCRMHLIPMQCSLRFVFCLFSLSVASYF